MRLNNLKRKRSEDDECMFSIQKKTQVYEKMVNASDSAKMAIIYEKTMGRLLQGSRKHKADSSSENRNEKSQMWQHIILLGNGSFDVHKDMEPFEYPLRGNKSRCCERNSYIQADCTCCPLPICEYCGHSCSECGKFLCSNCIMLFGCGTEESPLCETCRIFTNMH